jgi:hypothetical protein
VSGRDRVVWLIRAIIKILRQLIFQMTWWCLKDRVHMAESKPPNLHDPLLADRADAGKMPARPAGEGNHSWLKSGNSPRWQSCIVNQSRRKPRKGAHLGGAPPISAGITDMLLSADYDPPFDLRELPANPSSCMPWTH